MKSWGTVCAGGRRLVVALGVLSAALVGLSSADSPASAAGGAVAGDPSVSAVFAGQELAWSACLPPEEGVPLECAKMIAPLDWARPGGARHLEVTVSRIRATGVNRRGVLFTNFGGPGVPGGIYFPLFFHFFKPDIVAAYDVIGVDQRGSGESTPTFCTDDIEVELPADVRDRSRENLALLKSHAKAVLESCLQPTGDLARYTNTYQTVRDLDLLRSLLGERTISYYGLSAGTWLGAWYASEFPQRVDRFVFDGNLDFTTSDHENALSRPGAAQLKFETDFLPWIARYSGIYKYGTSARRAMATWEARRAKLAADPLVVNSGCTLRATDLDTNTWIYLAFDGVGGGGFLQLADALSILERFEDATPEEKQRLDDLFICVEEPEAPPGIGPAIVGVGCGDTPSPSYETQARESVQLGRRYPLMGWQAETLSGHCAFWPFPTTGKPRMDGKTLPPLLMVNNDRDPLTPLDGARRTAERLKSARLLVVKNESHHTIYGLGNECADGYIDHYLLTGELPKRGATCEGLPLPIPEGAAAATTALPQADSGKSLRARFERIVQTRVLRWR